MKANIGNLLAMMGGAMPQSTTEAKITELSNKLTNDKAVKLWKEAMLKIDELCGDPRGHSEAVTFCKMWLHDFARLQEKTAETFSIPDSISTALVYILKDIIEFSVVGNYEDMCESEDALRELAENREVPTELTNDEIEQISQELIELKIQEDEQKQCSPDGECCGGQLECGSAQDNIGQLYGKLDPKDPFGLS